MGLCSREANQSAWSLTLACQVICTWPCVIPATISLFDKLGPAHLGYFVMPCAPWVAKDSILYATEIHCAALNDTVR